MGRSGPRVSREERFFEKVKKSDGCWEWTAYKNNMGYGMFGGKSTDRPRLNLAHRVSYELAYGEIPKGALVLHRCDNPICVNPEHLFLGTFISNGIDMINKKRRADRISPETAYAILWEHRCGKRRKAVAKEYGVSTHIVKRISTRSTFKMLSATDHD